MRRFAVALACLACLGGGVGGGGSGDALGAREAVQHRCLRHPHRRRAPCPGKSKRKHRANPHAPASRQGGAEGGGGGGAGGGGGGGDRSGLPASPPGQVAPVAPPPSSGAGETGSSGEPPTAGAAHLQVSAREFTLALSHPAIAAGRTLLELVNAGQDEHDLHIRPAAGGSDVGAVGIVLPGRHADVEFHLAPGSYVLYCSMPAHEELGMKATLTVG